jgi:hypothetical protein
MMEIILGDFPSAMVRKVSPKLGYFKEDKVAYPLDDTDPKSIAFLESIQSIEVFFTH